MVTRVPDPILLELVPQPTIINKKNNESFTDVINRITNKRSIMELAGILSKKEADELKKNISEIRAASESRMEKIVERLK